MTEVSEVVQKATLASRAALPLANVSTADKNAALRQMADALVTRYEEIIVANEVDIENGRANGTSESLLDRLRLTKERIEDIAEGLRQIVELNDPIGELLETIQRPNGLQIHKIRVPIGVIGMIYEARPNVTVDAAGLALKTGNAIVLRGGSAALSSNRKIIEVLHDALNDSAVPADALQLIEDSDRASVNEMMKLNGLIDVIIPRGGSALIQNVVQNSTVPVIETGAGICHTYADESADQQMVADIAINAKVQRPSVCNSMETFLVHSGYDQQAFIRLAEQLRDEYHVELRGCPRTRELLHWATGATEQDYATEYNDYILNVKIVDSLDEALQHIATYGTKHSECIVTKDQHHANRFMQEVDAAAVYHNASTRFTDGFEFGFGAEIGISTQKLHARGPMGLPSLTSTKYRIYGTGQTRG
ncbi:glutamate-5-semialdehyde dehydrogenase [Paenibacillus sp. WLX2291]|uniref:glutamate-5-semialdehyde dehydrogenase n=1 Tax=Paenibacillus sp. WLX2291 TaxID=3296934 RepID=UPI0039844263